jgi:hypothetical protein
MITMAIVLVMAIVNFMSFATLVASPIVSQGSWSTLEHMKMLLNIVAVHLELSLPKKRPTSLPSIIIRLKDNIETFN